MNNIDTVWSTPKNQKQISEKELLVVSVGTSDSDSRRKTIEAIEEKLESEFSDFIVRRAFASQITIERIKKRDNLVVDNVKGALKHAIENGVKRLVIQPTHLMKGLGYLALVEEIADYSEAFEKVIVGEPLLSGEGDFRKVIKAITEKNEKYDDGKTAICFVGHGTEADSNQIYVRMQNMLITSGYTNYYIGTIKATPTLTEVFRMIQAGEYKKVVLQPLMIAVGNHTNNDIAGVKESSWKKAFENAGYEVECVFRGLGELEGIQELFAEHAHSAVERLNGD